MEHRRLRLAGATPTRPAASFSERLVTPGFCVAVTDTAQGAAAVRWALTLGEALRAGGHAVPVVITAFGAEPELEADVRARFSSAASELWTRGIAPELAAARALPSELGTSLVAACAWILVGEPALAAFDAQLAVLLEAERPLQLWPEPLVTFRQHFTLQLMGAPGEVAHRLAQALLPQLAP